MAQRRSIRPPVASRAGGAILLLALGALVPPGAFAQPAEALRPVQGGPLKNPAPPAPAQPARPAAPNTPAYALSAADAARTPPLAPDRPVRVSLPRGQSAFFRIAPEAGEAWAVATRRLSRNADTIVAALDDAGEVVAEDDDGGEESLASRLEIQPGDGARLLRVGTLENTGGRFEVVLTRVPVQPPSDLAASQAEAASRPPLAVDQPVRVRLRRNQQAFFALPADRSNLTARTRGLSSGTDTALALLDADGTVLAEDDDGGDGLASLLPIGRAANEPLTLRASLVGGTGSFELVLEREDPLAADFPTSLEAARARPPLTSGEVVHVELDRGGEAFFALPEGQPLTIVTRNLGDEVDTVLALLDAQGGKLSEDDDGGGGLASRVTTGGRAAFVRASLLNNARGGFDIAVAGTSEGTPGAGDVEGASRRPALVLGEAVRLTVEADGQAVVALPFDGRPALAMTFGLAEGLDTVLELLDAGGAVLAENDDAEGLASRLEIPAEPRPAYLRVRLLENKGGEVNLVLVRPAP
ncbi:hypothetical protein D9599_13275 [Roseomonas sp. KE2513]|uniref:hypothetical protein n=1 Tax=Roseomonas sp. KE2513 TaxID=2479202 RepID=UPI0018E03E42|nr:hypothetical protein [Roseomonas sp. KE2513]MBI0536548.1 hypothetical protein [Roseomonas sp. KE2513]